MADQQLHGYVAYSGLDAPFNSFLVNNSPTLLICDKIESFMSASLHTNNNYAHTIGTYNVMLKEQTCPLSQLLGGSHKHKKDVPGVQTMFN